MSYFNYVVQCEDCGKKINTAFSVVGLVQVASPVQICPKCDSRLLKKIQDGLDTTIEEEADK